MRFSYRVIFSILMASIFAPLVSLEASAIVVDARKMVAQAALISDAGLVPITRAGNRMLGPKRSFRRGSIEGPWRRGRGAMRGPTGRWFGGRKWFNSRGRFSSNRGWFTGRSWFNKSGRSGPSSYRKQRPIARRNLEAPSHNKFGVAKNSPSYKSSQKRPGRIEGPRPGAGATLSDLALRKLIKESYPVALRPKPRIRHFKRPGKIKSHDKRSYKRHAVSGTNTGYGGRIKRKGALGGMRPYIRRF